FVEQPREAHGKSALRTQADFPPPSTGFHVSVDTVKSGCPLPGFNTPVANIGPQDKMPAFGGARNYVDIEKFTARLDIAHHVGQTATKRPGATQYLTPCSHIDRGNSQLSVV